MAVPDAQYALSIGGTWTDVTSAVRKAGGNVSHTRGRPEGAARVDPSFASLAIESPDGLYSNRNPASPYYGLLGRNTPIRCTVAGPAYLSITSSAAPAAASTPDNAALNVVGNLDLRIDVLLDDWTGAQDIASRYLTTGDNRSWALTLGATGLLVFNWSPDGTLPNRKTATSTAAVPASDGQRMALRAVLNTTNSEVTFYTARTIGDDWVQLGDTVPQGSPAATSVFDGAASVEIGSTASLVDPSFVGRCYALQLRNGAGTLIIDLDFSDADAGDTTLVDGTGLTWTINSPSVLDDRWDRFNLSVAQWPPSWHVSGHDQTVSLQASGLLQQLDKGQKPLDSAILRFIRANSPLECWPLTDGAHAFSGAPLVSTSRMKVLITSGTRRMRWSEGSLGDWIEPVAELPTETTGTIAGQVPNSTAAASGWSADLCVAWPTTVGSVDFQVTDRSAGTDAEPRVAWYITLSPSSNQVTLDFAAVGETTSSVTALATVSNAFEDVTDGPHHIRLSVTPGGASSGWTLYINGVSRASGTHGAGSKVARRVRPGWFLGSVTDDPPSIGYVTYWGPTAPTAADTYAALHGHEGEDAVTRVQRLGAEKDVSVQTIGLPAESTLMGSQRFNTFLDLLGECEASDGGVLYEQRDDVGLVYRNRSSQYNQTPRMVLSYEQLAPPFSPVDDDRGPFPLQNDITVTRIGGSAGQVIVDEGPLSVDAVGRYDVAVDLSLADDDQPLQNASWLTHLHTWDEARYPSVRLMLHKYPALVADVVSLDVGDTIRITDLPSWLPPGDVDLLVMGYKEEIGPLTWDLTMFCAPAGPWTVGVVEDEDQGRADTDSCELVTAVDADDTALLVASTGDARWVDSATYPSDFPFDLTIGGETVTATAITGSMVDAFGRTTSNGWGNADIGGTYSTGGGAASDYAVGSGYGSHTLTNVDVSRRTSLAATSADFDVYCDIATSALSTGASMFGAVMARFVDVDNLYMARLEFTTAAAILLTIRERAAGVEAALGSSFTTGLTHVAGTFVRVRFQGVGTALRAKAWLASATEPQIWHITTSDATLTGAGRIGCRSIRNTASTNVNPQLRFDNLLLANPQIITATRSVNTVAKSHAAGADIRLATTTIVAL